MSIQMTGTGGLYTRLGREIALVNKKSTEQATDFTTDTDTIYAQYTTAQRDVVDGLADVISALRSAQGSMNQSIIDIGQQTLQTMAADDAEVPSYTLQEALLILKNQMILGGWNILQPTISASNTALPTTNYGDGQQLVIAKTPNGLPLMDAFAEVVNAVCITDYYLDGGGSQGVESFQVVSETAVDPSAYNWPQGSGVNTTISASFGPKSARVADASFENWNVSNQLVNWTLTQGTYGVTVNKVNTTAAQDGFGGTYSVQFVQSANTSEIVGTLQGATAGTTYPFAFFGKRDSGTSGTITFSLRDSADGTGQLTMDNGFPASVAFTIDSSNFPTGVWTLFTGVLFTPTFSPANGINFVINVTSSGALTFVLDDVCPIQVSPLYNGGPSYAIFSGYTPFRRDDAFRFTVTASNGVATFSRSTDRFWNLRDNNVRLPSVTGGNNISDSLISLS